jgi:hypothetical protein
MSPFRHLQSANVVDAQMCSKEKLIDQHANATERRGHLGQNKAAQKPWPFGRNHLRRLVTRLQTYKCADILWANLTNPSRELSERSTPPSRMRHQKAYCVCRQIHAKRQQHTTQCRHAPASRLRTSARVPSADAVRGSRSQLIVLFRTGHLSAPTPWTQVQPGFNVWGLAHWSAFAIYCHGLYRSMIET